MSPDDFFAAVYDHQLGNSVAARYADGQYATSAPERHMPAEVPEDDPQRSYKREYMRRWREAHADDESYRERQRTQVREWAAANKGKTREYKRDWMRMKRAMEGAK